MAISTPSRATNEEQRTSAGIPKGVRQYVQDLVRKPGSLLIDGEWVERSRAEGPEMGHNALENYLETKSVVSQLASRDDHALPRPLPIKEETP